MFKQHERDIEQKINYTLGTYWNAIKAEIIAILLLIVSVIAIGELEEGVKPNLVRLKSLSYNHNIIKWNQMFFSMGRNYSVKFDHPLVLNSVGLWWTAKIKWFVIQFQKWHGVKDKKMKYHSKR